MKFSSRSTRALVALLVCVALFRGAFAFWVSGHDSDAIRSPDTPAYVGSARALVEDHRFAEQPGSSTPMFLRTPGYPAFLAVLFAVGDSERAAVVVQALVSVVAALAVAAVAAAFIGRRAAVVAALLVAIDPLQFAASGTLLTESLAAIAMCAIALAGIRVFARERVPVRLIDVGLLGLAVALATLVRPTTYYLPIPLLGLLLWRVRKDRRRRVALCACFAAPLVLLVGSWQLRNHNTVDSWRLSSSESVTLYCYEAPAVEADASNISLAAARDHFGCSNEILYLADCAPWWSCPRDPLAPAGPYYDKMASEGISVLAKHPIETLKMHSKGLARVTLGPGTNTVARYLSIEPSLPLKGLLTAWILAVLSLAVVGALAVRRAPTGLYWPFLALLVVYVLVLSSGYEGSARMRTPVQPLICLLAAAGAERLWSKQFGQVVRLRDRRRSTDEVVRAEGAESIDIREPASVGTSYIDLDRLQEVTTESAVPNTSESAPESTPR